MESWNIQPLGYRLTLCERRRKSQHRAEGWHEIGGLQRAVENYSLANAGAQCHHPGGAGERVAGAMMLESVATGIVVRVTAKVRQNKESRLAGVFRLALDGLPDVGAEAVRAAGSLYCVHR